MESQFLILMFGLPMSGKSSWARKQGIPIVNPDSIRLSLYGQAYIQLAEPMVWTIAEVMARSLLHCHDGIIIDATNTTQKRRSFWINKFSECEIRYKAMLTTKEVCIARAKERSREDLLPIIERMAANIEYLGFDEEIL